MGYYSQEEALGVLTDPQSPGTHRKWSGTRFSPVDNNVTSS